MKCIFAVAIAAALLSLSGCQNPARRAYQLELAQQGLIGYIPPQGDPTVDYDWQKYGPGAIVRVSTGAFVVPADRIVGDQGVKKARERLTKYHLFANKRFARGEVDLSGTIAAQQLQVAEASLSASGLRAIEISFVRPRISNPFSIDYMTKRYESIRPLLSEAVRKELDRGKAKVVNDVVIADGMRFHFSSQKTAGVTASATFTAGQKATLNAQGLKIFEGGIEIQDPVFIAFRGL